MWCSSYQRTETAYSCMLDTKSRGYFNTTLLNAKWSEVFPYSVGGREWEFSEYFANLVIKTPQFYSALVLLTKLDLKLTSLVWHDLKYRLQLHWEVRLLDVLVTVWLQKVHISLPLRGQKKKASNDFSCLLDSQSLSLNLSYTRILLKKKIREVICLYE